MSADIFSSWELTAQQSDLLREMGLTQEQARSLETAMAQSRAAGQDSSGDKVQFSPEAVAMALQYVQQSEESPSPDLSMNRENADDGAAPQDGSDAATDGTQGAAVSAPAAMSSGDAQSGTDSSSDDRIDELEEEIDELEQEILELRGKSDEQSKQELKVKENELAMKQSELAELQANQA